MGQPLEMLMPERFRRRPCRLRQSFLANMQSRLMGEGLALFGRRKDGSEFPLEIGLSPIELDGETMVLAGIIDVTARHEIEREKEQQRRELARSNADLEEFAYAASHDLKAPLRAIAHLVQWIGEDVAPTASPRNDGKSQAAGRAGRAAANAAGWAAGLRARRPHADTRRDRSTSPRWCATSRRCWRHRRLRHRLRGRDGGASAPIACRSGWCWKPDRQRAEAP